MKRKHSCFIALVVAVSLVAACGPTMSTPTPSGGNEPVAAATKAPTTAAPTQVDKPTAKPVAPPVDPNDWHVLGSPDAPVTMIEYSDFQ
jgi:protein-disulfide isomerase